MDLKQLATLASATPRRGAILAPADADDTLRDVVTVLRQQGERVIQALPGQRTGLVDHGCDRQLELIDGRWQPTTLTQETSA
jgi:ATP phosphoribosyltransferase regulatory subunit